jgi:hypothetical protein
VVARLFVHDVCEFYELVNDERSEALTNKTKKTRHVFCDILQLRAIGPQLQKKRGVNKKQKCIPLPSAFGAG